MVDIVKLYKVDVAIDYINHDDDYYNCKLTLATYSGSNLNTLLSDITSDYTSLKAGKSVLGIDLTNAYDTAINAVKDAISKGL